jgi:hypothetical protein
LSVVSSIPNFFQECEDLLLLMCMYVYVLERVNKSGHGLGFIIVMNILKGLFFESTQIIVIMEIWVMMMDIINLNWVHTSPNKSKTLFPSISMKPWCQMGWNEWYLHVTPPTLNSKSLSQGGSSTRQKK